ncbi:hypothetical protein [Duganella sp. BuS-21]|uniref:hypothetical protein n=1 Tax=Duganella sp. BuS-21 TaxID=2943848 RepID=UPI0035A6B635
MMVNLSKMIPTPVEVGREGLIVLGGLLIAAFILSRFPKVRDWVTGQSITVKDNRNNILF